MNSIACKRAIDELVDWYEKGPIHPAISDCLVRFEDATSDRGWWYRATSRSLLPDALEDYTTERPWFTAQWQETAGALEWYDGRPAIDPEILAEIWDSLEAGKDGGLGPDFGSRVHSIEDRSTFFPGGDAAAFASDYVRSLPLGWRDSTILSLTPGAPVVVVRWTPDRVPIEVTQRCVVAWNAGAEVPRWRVLNEFLPGNDCVRVPIPPAVRPRLSIGDIVARAPERPTDIIPLSIEPLNRVLTIGGVPLRGARCFVQGATGIGKSAVLLESAVGYAARGHGVGWIATRDEPPESVCVRLRQREGVPRVEAERMPFEAMHVGGNLAIVDGRAHTLEDVLAVGFDVLFIDPIQKVQTRAGANGGRLEGIATALELIENSGVTTWMSSVITRGSERRSAMSASFGGSGIESGATLLLDVRKEGDALAVEVLKSRYGGERERFSLRLDRERQRVTAPGDDADARIRADLLAAARAEPRSRRALTEATTGRAAVVRRVLAAMLKAGELVDRDGVVGLP